MKAAVISFPGSNCERDMAVALERVTGRAPLMVWHGDCDLDQVDLIALPGGFSYGDYLRAGAIAARSPIMKTVVARARAGVAVLGVCNGFQILTEVGLLPGALTRNAGLRYICRQVHLEVAGNDSLFTCGYQAGAVVRMPIAHADGNYRADAETMRRLQGEGQVAFRYCQGETPTRHPANPNGSMADIAGICNAAGNVMGMMPHPERAIDPLHGGTDGLALFTGLAGPPAR